MKKRLVSVMFVVALTAMVMVGCNGETEKNDTTGKEETLKQSDSEAVKDTTENDDEIVIGLSLMDYSFEFFQDMIASARKTAEENGVTLIELDGASDVQKQLSGVEDMLSNFDLDAIFLNPVDSDAIGPATLAANAAGVPVVTVDVRSAEGEVFAHVASNNEQIGSTAAEYAVELLKERYQGEIKGTVIVMSYPQITSMAERSNGFIEYMEDYPDVEVVEISPVELSVTNAQSLWDDTMISYPEGAVDVVFGSNAQCIDGIIAATESAARTDFEALGVDNDEVTMEALAKNSFLAATVVQSPVNMGKKGVEMCIAAAKGETIESSEVATTLILVTREGYEEFRKQNEAERESLKNYYD